jgi:hypothetical protein
MFSVPWLWVGYNSYDVYSVPCMGSIIGILTYRALFLCFLPDEEWKGVSPNRHCWFYSEVAYYTSKKDTFVTTFFASGVIQLILSIFFFT